MEKVQEPVKKWEFVEMENNRVWAKDCVNTTKDVTKEKGIIQMSLNCMPNKSSELKNAENTDIKTLKIYTSVNVKPPT